MTDHLHIDQEALRSVAEHHFKRTRFSEVIDSGPQRARALIGALPDTQQRGVLALLGAELLDLPAPMSHVPEGTYRAVLRRLELTGLDLLPSAGNPRRLDFDSGVQVVEPVVASGP